MIGKRERDYSTCSLYTVKCSAGTADSNETSFIQIGPFLMEFNVAVVCTRMKENAEDGIASSPQELARDLYEKK